MTPSLETTMPNANTEHSRKLRQETANAWIQDQVRRGGCRLSLVLPAEARAKLDRLAAMHDGNRTAAIIAAIDRATADPPQESTHG
jgi:hypothetical protein